MQIDLVFIVIMLGHILGDFYFQSDKLAKKRQEKYSAVLLHSLIYAFTIAGVMHLCAQYSVAQIYLFVAISISHFVIDTIKHIIQRRSEGSWSWLKQHILVIDQLLHFSALFGFWFLWGRNVQVRWFVSQEMVHLPDLPIIILFGILLSVRPVGIWIAGSNLRNYWPQQPNSDLTFGSTKNGGKTIGYLERVIVLVFLMYQQFGAIAFVLTAKSVARFKEIEKNQDRAEYYLIGTLMSVGSAMLIAVLLGLTQ